MKRFDGDTLPKVGDLIILENGNGGNITNMIRLNDGRYIISFAPINGKSTTFREGDYHFSIRGKDLRKVWIKFY